MKDGFMPCLQDKPFMEKLILKIGVCANHWETNLFVWFERNWSNTDLQSKTKQLQNHGAIKCGQIFDNCQSIYAHTSEVNFSP